MGVFKIASRKHICFHNANQTTSPTKPTRRASSISTLSPRTSLWGATFTSWEILASPPTLRIGGSSSEATGEGERMGERGGWVRWLSFRGSHSSPRPWPRHLGRMRTRKNIKNTTFLWSGGAGSNICWKWWPFPKKRRLSHSSKSYWSSRRFRYQLLVDLRSLSIAIWTLRKFNCSYNSLCNN